MVKRIIVWMVLALAVAAASAQEVLLPLQSGPIVPRRKAVPAAVALPFFDDFASGGGTLAPTLWIQGGATAGNGDRLLPPTIGVATLDAIDAEGNLYPLANTSLFTADTLESVPIKLDTKHPRDSVVLSFYYLPGGGHGNLWERTGEMPDAQDSLFLDFYDTRDCVWVTVWGREGISVDTLRAHTGSEWQYVAIALSDEVWFDSTFRFRFRNYCTLESTSKVGMSGNCDMWHIDYVLLDYGRSVVATPEFRDVAFVAPASSLLDTYRAMPARQYRSSDMASSLEMTIGNLYSSALATHYGYVVVDGRGDTVYRYDGGYENAPPFLPTGNYQTASAHATPALGYVFPEMREHTTYIVLHTVREGNAQDGHPQNDTVRYRQVFADYYAYDDGTAENGYGLTSTASRVYLAYRFDLNEEDTLTAIDLYFNRAYQGGNEQVPFLLTVWRAEAGIPGTVLYRDMERRYPAIEGLDTYHRYLLEVPTVVQGSIFVGFEQENNHFINLGFDRSLNSADRIYYLTGTEWQQSILSGSLMMRPCFGESARVSLGEVEEFLLPSVYPNPAADVLHINGVGEGARVEMYDVMGRKVYIGNGRTVCTTGFPEGLYMLRVIVRGGMEVWTQKIIIVH